MMKLNEFKIGRVFYIGERKWLCTDIGTRTVAAICLTDACIVKNGKKEFLSEAELKARGWTAGPPYSLAEQCIDENDFPACSSRVAVRSTAAKTAHGSKPKQKPRQALAGAVS